MSSRRSLSPREELVEIPLSPASRSPLRSAPKSSLRRSISPVRTPSISPIRSASPYKSLSRAVESLPDDVVDIEVVELPRDIADEISPRRSSRVSFTPRSSATIESIRPSGTRFTPSRVESVRPSGTRGGTVRSRVRSPVRSVSPVRSGTRSPVRSPSPSRPRTRSTARSGIRSPTRSPSPSRSGTRSGSPSPLVQRLIIDPSENLQEYFTNVDLVDEPSEIIEEALSVKRPDTIDNIANFVNSRMDKERIVSDLGALVAEDRIRIADAVDIINAIAEADTRSLLIEFIGAIRRSQ